MIDNNFGNINSKLMIISVTLRIHMFESCHHNVHESPSLFYISTLFTTHIQINSFTHVHHYFHDSCIYFNDWLIIISVMLIQIDDNFDDVENVHVWIMSLQCMRVPFLVLHRYCSLHTLKSIPSHRFIIIFVICNMLCHI